MIHNPAVLKIQHICIDSYTSIFIQKNLADFLLFMKNDPSHSNLCHFYMNRATITSLVAYERSFKADLLPHVVLKIILSENGDIWVERWTKTFVLGCSTRNIQLCHLKDDSETSTGAIARTYLMSELCQTSFF